MHLPQIQRIRAVAAKAAENMAAALLAAMFFAFLLQIFSRYVLSSPISWTLELCLTLWVWLVFFGNAFIVRHREHVIFDVVYRQINARWQRLFALASALAIVVGFIVSFLPTWDYIDFLKIKKSATLRIPMRSVFSIYGVFMLAIIITYAARFVYIWRHGIPEDEKDDNKNIEPEASK